MAEFISTKTIRFIMKNSFDQVEAKPASLKDLFRFASKTDYVLMFIGSLTVIALGTLQPFLLIGVAAVYGGISPTTTPEDCLLYTSPSPRDS